MSYPLREHVVRADRTGTIVRRTRRAAIVFAALAAGSVLADVVIVRWLEPAAWWTHTTFLLLLAPIFAWYALAAARFLPRMRGDYVVRLEDDRVIASWGGERTAEVRLTDSISLRPVWPSGRGFVLVTPRGKVLLYPELERLGEIVVELQARGIGDEGIPFSERHAFVGGEERREPVPAATSDAELARIARLEAVSGSVAVVGFVAGVVAALTHSSLTLGAWMIALLSGGVSMAARGRYIAKHGVYRFLGGAVLVREATHARRAGAVLVACGALIAGIGALGALVVGIGALSAHWL